MELHLFILLYSDGVDYFNEYRGIFTSLVELETYLKSFLEKKWTYKKEDIDRELSRLTEVNTYGFSYLIVKLNFCVALDKNIITNS